MYITTCVYTLGGEILCSDPRANCGDVYVSADCRHVSITYSSACRCREFQLITRTHTRMCTCIGVQGESTHDLVHVHHTCMYLYSLTLCLLFTGVPSIVTT